jgi:hypothetical protein
MRSTFFQRLVDYIRRGDGRRRRGVADAHPSLHEMVRGIMTTREDEIACDECFDLLDRFAELVLEGKSPEKQMALVQHHLEHCPECQEEYEMLLKSLRSMHG